MLSLSCCKKGKSQHRKIELSNPNFNKKLESLLRFSIPLISVHELNDQIEDVIIIDTREEGEYEVSHIPGAQHGGYKNFDINNFGGLPKQNKIVLYCSVGYRSEKIAEKMKAAGFTNVYNLYGSIFEWVNSGYSIVDSSGKKADTIHTYSKKWGKWIDDSKIKKTY